MIPAHLKEDIDDLYDFFKRMTNNKKRFIRFLEEEYYYVQVSNGKQFEIMFHTNGVSTHFTFHYHQEDDEVDIHYNDFIYENVFAEDSNAIEKLVYDMLKDVINAK